MRILVNLGTIKRGGGQNVGLNFIEAISNMRNNCIDFEFLSVKGSAISKRLQENGYFIRYVPKNPYFRIIVERFIGFTLLLRRNKKVDIVYTMFGYGSFGKHIKQVSGVADSNLFYPEVDFWKEYHGLKLKLKRLVDSYRLNGYKKSAGLIFENEDIHQRYLTLFDSGNSTTFIRPSFYSTTFQDVILCRKQLGIDDRSVVGLFLCGWQLNKNILIIPRLIRFARNNGVALEIVLTAKKNDSEECYSFISECQKYKVNQWVHIIGPVSKEALPSLYSLSNYIFLLSQLESFSNNIIEAWNYHRVLITSNLDWSRSICGQAALYVSRDDEGSIVTAIKSALPNTKEYEKITNSGDFELRKYPTINERTCEEIEFIKKVGSRDA